ncbi:hypothetical protein [Falsiroseomonas oryzae]|uniref:hypothetical protein n=1 Tax=Falsiroseomonas oryzae TaxID=2766473 RepID=UPI0022EAAB29|nr:hypothetical protein [Roseomonas sp. MO-31]
MRRPALLACLALTLLAPPPAAAQAPDALCTALRRLAEAAANGFDYLPTGQRYVPGSVEERRGVLRPADGPARAVFYATMAMTNSAQRGHAFAQRAHALETDVGRCFPQAEASGMQPVQHGAFGTWTLPRAVIALRRDDGDGGLSSAEIELSVASRW